MKMYLNILIINILALLVAYLFYRKSAPKFPYLKAVALYNFSIWIAAGLVAWRFVARATLLSPFQDFAKFIVAVLVAQCVVNLCAHILERFAR